MKKLFVFAVVAMFSTASMADQVQAKEKSGSETAIKKIATVEAGQRNQLASTSTGSSNSPGTPSSGSNGWTPQKTISPPWNAGYQPHRMISKKAGKESYEITESTPDTWTSMRSYEEAMAKKGERTMVIVNGRRF